MNRVFQYTQTSGYVYKKDLVLKKKKKSQPGGNVNKRVNKYILRYAQKSLEQRRNLSCGGGWGFIIKFHWGQTLEIVVFQ